MVLKLFKVEKVIFNCGSYIDLENELIKALDKKKIRHYSCIKDEVDKEVRNSIKRLGETILEDLPTPDKSLKELEKESKKLKEQ